MDLQSVPLRNDRVRSELCRKQKHIYASCSSEASKHNKMLPSTYILENTKCLYEDRWILNYRKIEFKYTLELERFTNSFPARVIQRCHKCDFDLERDPINRKRVQRVVVLMKNLQYLKLLLGNARMFDLLELVHKHQRYFRYLSFFKREFSIRCRDVDSYNGKLLLRCEPALLTSFSTVYRAFHVENHIPNILNMVSPINSSVKTISAAVCLRLSNITDLIINLSKEEEVSKEEVSKQLVDSLALLDHLKSLKIELSDTEAYAKFFHFFAAYAQRLEKLSELSVFFDFLSLRDYIERHR